MPHLYFLVQTTAAPSPRLHSPRLHFGHTHAILVYFVCLFVFSFWCIFSSAGLPPPGCKLFQEDTKLSDFFVLQRLSKALTSSALVLNLFSFPSSKVAQEITHRPSGPGLSGLHSNRQTKGGGLEDSTPCRSSAKLSPQFSQARPRGGPEASPWAAGARGAHASQTWPVLLRPAPWEQRVTTLQPRELRF